MNLKKAIMYVCAALLLCLGIYMNWNIGDFAMKAVTFSKFWEIIAFVLCIAVICYALFEKNMGVKYTAIVVMALMLFYYIGNLIPFDKINDFMNGIHDTLLRILSIVFIAGSVVWIMAIKNHHSTTGNGGGAKN